MSAMLTERRQKRGREPVTGIGQEVIEGDETSTTASCTTARAPRILQPVEFTIQATRPVRVVSPTS